jgi:hypothetical protein
MSARTSSSQLVPHFVLAIAVCLALGYPLLPGLAHAQEVQKTPSALDSALARVGAGDASSARDVVVIANAGAVQAVPALEKEFKRATDVDVKLSIAAGLVKLRDHDDTYWNFLLEQATLVVDSDIPDSAYSQSQGKMVRMGMGPELQAWADAHNVPVITAAQHARYDFPTKVLQLARTGDPRGIPLLRRALQSRNYLIAAFGAMGLAEIRDKKSIPLIVAAAKNAPAGAGASIAEPLIYFDDDQAQAAVDAHVPREKARALREARANGQGIFGR